MATKANLVIDQGTSYSTNIDILDEYDIAIDLTNYTCAAQIRKHYTSSNAISFSVNLGGADGTVILSLTANATANMAAGRYVYDVELTSDTGVVSRVLEGVVIVTPNVTR
jgi:hypothetical protein